MRRPVAVLSTVAVVLLVAGCGGGPGEAGAPVASTQPPVTAAPATEEPTAAPATEEPTEEPAEPTEEPAGPTEEPATEEPTAAPSTAAPTAAPSTAAPAPAAPPASARPPVTRALRTGDSGPQVEALQERLLELGYWLPEADGEYGDSTRHAVVALQKAAGLGRDGVAGAKTRAALAKGTRPRARATRGHVIEVDLGDQLLMVVDDGKIERILDTSTGSGVTYTAPSGSRNTANTPTGTFETSWQVNGWREGDLGRLYRPKYFHPRGIAVHGYSSVPAYPASHGCVRVTMTAMDALWRENLMPIGTTVFVHR